MKKRLKTLFYGMTHEHAHFTHRDDVRTFLNLLALGRFSVDGYVADVRAPADCGAVYSRLAEGGAFPVTQFDWSEVP